MDNTQRTEFGGFDQIPVRRPVGEENGLAVGVVTEDRGVEIDTAVTGLAAGGLDRRSDPLGLGFAEVGSRLYSSRSFRGAQRTVLLFFHGRQGQEGGGEGAAVPPGEFDQLGGQGVEER